MSMKRLSIRLLVTLVVVVPIAAVSALLVGISTLTHRRIADELGNQIVNSATDSVIAQVRAYLQDSVRVSDLYARRVQNGTIPAMKNLINWEPFMLDDLATNRTVASICFGNIKGDSTWLLRAHGRLEAGRVDGSRDCYAVEYAVDPATETFANEPLRVYHYDARRRPWYAAALQSDRPLWTPIYFWFGEGGEESETGTGYTRAIRDADGNVLGVLVVDVTLGALSDYLKRLSFARQGKIILIDEQDQLVAASEGRVNSAAGRRLALREAPDSAVRAMGMILEKRPKGAARDLRIIGDGKPMRADVTALEPFGGIKWRAIALLPEATFLAEAQAEQQRSVALGLVATAGGLYLGVRLSRRLAEPFLQLVEHVRKIGDGDFESRLALNASREFAALSDELNAMAAGLKQRMELQRSMELAMHVQQSLLPAGVPRLPGVDVAAHSRYCEATGGDYYDFVEVAPLSGHRLLVALGDVMGHGIGAALLMATARAALRASCADPRGLGDLMNRVNRVLTQDARHGRFMTMSLLVIDPGGGRVRWARAGQDPFIVYDPQRNEFQELDEGEAPLGIDESIEYGEYESDALADGAILLGGTDGIWEARDVAGEFFGKARLRELMRRHASESAQEIADAIVVELQNFTAGSPIKDDITFVILKLAAVLTPREDVVVTRQE